MIKRITVCVIFSVMMAAALNGCGKTEESTEPVEVTEAVSEETTELSEATTEAETEDETETEAATEAETEVVTEAETEASTETVTESEAQAEDTAKGDQSSDIGKQVEYGNTIKVHFVRQARGAVSESQGKDSNEFVILEEGDKEFTVSKETTDVFSPYDYEVEEEQIMENVNKAIGLKKGDSFTIGSEFGDGWYETIYEILDIY